MGSQSVEGGRAGEAPSTELAKKLDSYGFKRSRLKTGTPPRIDGRTIDFSALIEQPGETPSDRMFSTWGNKETKKANKQLSCWISHTNLKTHKIIKNSIHLSPMYNGSIKSSGLVIALPLKTKLLDLKKETLTKYFWSQKVWIRMSFILMGFQLACRLSCQVEMVHSIKGLEKAHIIRPGYAIEYDYYDPRCLFPTLKQKY